jgi:hypothetical protein
MALKQSIHSVMRSFSKQTEHTKAEQEKAEYLIVL